MSALDDLAKLKQRRRDEIAAVAQAAREAALAADRRSQEALEEAILRVLSEEGLLDFAQFRAAKEPHFSRGRVSVYFDVPGHREIALQLKELGSDQWRGCVADVDGPARWDAVINGDHICPYSDIADALIAAEIEGWEPPAPPPSAELSDEEQHAASRAWDAMTQADHMMPAIYALDMVTDEILGGDQGRAAYALHVAAGLWLDRLRPEQPVEVGKGESVLFRVSSLCASNLRQGYLDEAYGFRIELEGLNTIPILMGTDEERIHATGWLQWCKEADRAMRLCVAVAEAANTKEAA